MSRQKVAYWNPGTLALTIAATVALLGSGAAANAADVLGIQNNAAFGGGPIVTVDLTTNTFVNSFVPDNALNCSAGSCNGRGVEVLGNFIYYTELNGGFSASDGIHVAPFNNGAGGHDIKVFPNPVPGTGVVDLAAAGGELYAMTGYPNGPEVVQATDGNGNNIGGQVTLKTLSGGDLTASDGFTVLPNGNWLINDGDAVNSYNQYDPITGMEIAGTNVVSHTTGGAVCGSSTGVDNDAFLGGNSLYFDCNFDSIVQDSLSGAFIAVTSTLPPGSGGEDISLVQETPITPPSAPEPASLSILGAALVGFAWLRRRQRSV